MSRRCPIKVNLALAATLATISRSHVVTSAQNPTFTGILNAIRIPDSPTLAYHLKSLAPFIEQRKGTYHLTPMDEDAFNLLPRKKQQDIFASRSKSDPAPFQIETQRGIVSFYHTFGGGDIMPAVVKAFIERHIQHIKFPSKKSEIVAACAGMAEVPKADKEWIEQNLPDGNYKSADEVIRALKL